MSKVFSIDGNTISYGGFMLRELGSGALTISKTVTGSGFDPAKTFELVVTFDKAVTYNGTTSTTHTLNLASGQSATITNIPEGTTYSVVESPLSQEDIDAGYSVGGITGASGTIADNGSYVAAASNSFAGMAAGTIRFEFENASYDPRNTNDVPYNDAWTPYSDRFLVLWRNAWTQVSASPNVWDYTQPPSDQVTPIVDLSKFLISSRQRGRIVRGNVSGFRDGFALADNPYLTSVGPLDCTGITSFEYNDYVAQSARRVGVFHGNSLMASVRLLHTSSVTSLYKAFYNCSALQSLTMDMSGVTTAGHAFAGSGLTSANFDMPSIDSGDDEALESAFEGCGALKTLALRLGSGSYSLMKTFKNCVALESAAISFADDNVHSVDLNNAFYQCYALTQVTAPKLRAGDMTATFYKCTSLASAANINMQFAASGTLTSAFYQCRSLEGLPDLSGRRTTNINSMCTDCAALKAIPSPLIAASSVVQYVGYAFSGCVNVESGALALYNRLSGQTTPPPNHQECFKDCGSNTVTGAAELAQIPSDWK